MTVIKRTGKIEKLSKKKIFDSISNANLSVSEEERLTQYQLNRITDSIYSFCDSQEEPISIDVLENIIEKKIMEHGAYEVAKRYITYRYEKERVRNLKNLTEKLTASNVQNSNANMDEFSFSGRVGEAASYVMRDYALNNLMSKKMRLNHINNEIYVHDLDHYAIGDHNCLSIPFDDLLKNGFNTRQTDVRPASSINTAFQLIAVIFQLQSLQQFGGVAATHLDWTMVPYVRKSFWKHYKDGLSYICHCDILNEFDPDMSIDDEFYKNKMDAYNYALDQTKKELDQAVEGMYHNLNTLQSRAGGQLPFTSINYGTCTLTEGRMVTKSLLDGCIKGVGKFHKTAIFPCGIFQLMNNVNKKEGDPNYDLFQLALQSTAKRIYPNYVNCEWSNDNVYDRTDPKQFPSTMGCRTYLGFDINGMGSTKDGRGNISPVTIILPTLAMEAKEKIEKLHENEKVVSEDEVVEAFMKILDKKINEAKDMLLERFDWQCSQSPKSAKFMYENNVIAGYIPEEGIKSALKHGSFGIGQIGLAEALQILIDCDHTVDKGMELAKKIETMFRDKCAKFKKELKLNFANYYTPAEGLSHTALCKFRQKYGVIPKVSDKDWFTNSIHVPVTTKIDAFKKIDIESQLTGYSGGGCISYVELDGDMSKNIKALEQLVLYAMDKDIPYLALNTKRDTCLNCGYSDVTIKDECPECHCKDKIQRLRRVTGYITGDYKTAFNYGKQKETENRVEHTGVEITE